MITPDYVRCMAAYNAEMNLRLYTAAGRLPDDERRRDRGAFFGSIHRTFNHLLWGDQMWLSRFGAGPKPPVPGAESTTMVADFGELTQRRVGMDSRLESWANGVSEAWLQDNLTWLSGVRPAGSRATLQLHWAAIGRPRVDDAHAAHRLFAWHPLRAAGLCDEVHLNLAYRWFCRLGLDGCVPDHSTFSKNRHGRFHNGDVHRLLFEEVVRACTKAGLVADATRRLMRARSRPTLAASASSPVRHLLTPGTSRNARPGLCATIPAPTYKALSELGKAVKTTFLAGYLADQALRREINDGLNVVEQWNSANDFIFFARHGEFSSNRRENQEMSMLSLHLLQNCIIYVSTLMLQQVLARLEWKGRLNDRDFHALTPLFWGHVNPYGRFELDMATRIHALA